MPIDLDNLKLLSYDKLSELIIAASAELSSRDKEWEVNVVIVDLINLVKK